MAVAPIKKNNVEKIIRIQNSLFIPTYDFQRPEDSYKGGKQQR